MKSLYLTIIAASLAVPAGAQAANEGWDGTGQDGGNCRDCARPERGKVRPSMDWWGRKTPAPAAEQNTSRRPLEELKQTLSRQFTRINVERAIRGGLPGGNTTDPDGLDGRNDPPSLADPPPDDGGAATAAPDDRTPLQRLKEEITRQFTAVQVERAIRGGLLREREDGGQNKAEMKKDEGGSGDPPAAEAADQTKTPLEKIKAETKKSFTIINTGMAMKGSLKREKADGDGQDVETAKGRDAERAAARAPAEAPSPLDSLKEDVERRFQVVDTIPAAAEGIYRAGGSEDRAAWEEEEEGDEEE
jgi:hypothetical protein